jgi:hypothetical protein
MRGAFDGVVACDLTSVHVSFDPAARVSVTAADTTLASATFDDRRASADCEVDPGAVRTTMESTPYDSTALSEGLYRRAEFDCRVAGGVRIDMHPIFNANIGRNDGSTLLVLDGMRVVVSAVLKNKGDPRASRVYHAPRYCTLG